jgi:penicillin-binding protein 1A
MTFVPSSRVRTLPVAGGLLLGAALVAAGTFYFMFLRNLPELRTLDDYRPPLSSRVYDREGRLIGEFFTERRRLVALEDLPSHVIHAFVAGEDSTFFEHSGIDLTSILRAAWVNLRAGGEIKQGGSTITQQMVKGLLLSPERKFRRKIREMILARDMEKRFTKQEILFLYLNQIYFGHGAYGIGEAAQSYFAKEAKDLTVSEGAMLAGLPKAPSRYSPHLNPDQAEHRRLYVLGRMQAEDFLDARRYAEAVAEEPVVVKTRLENQDVAAYFNEEVRRFLFDELGGDEVLRGGLTIETTLDIELQRAAVAALRRGLIDLSKRQGYRGPLRRVESSEISAELERLAVENGLAAPPEEEPEEEESDAEALAGDEAPATPPEVPALADAEPPTLEGDGPFLGVVTAVDEDTQSATVGFAPGLEATVRLDNVSWARKPDPSSAPRAVKSIRRIFKTGDVAPFVPIIPLEDGDEEMLLVSLFQDPQVEGALLSLDVEKQEVLSLVGGYDFGRSQFNRVTQARRQPGSAFKPIIYAAALSKDYTSASIIHDRPVVYVDETSGFIWRPRNYGRAFYGPITLREALVRSVNNATVHLFRDLGVGYVIRYARRLGIESPLNRDLSLALGSSDLSLLELTRAYAVFAARGRRVLPTFIRRVVNRDGEVLLENIPLGDTPPEFEPAEATPDLVDVAAAPDEDIEVFDPEQLIPAEQAYLVADLLRAVVADPHGTGWRLRALGRPVAGKTGTTNDQGDAWFMGFSPDIATGVWVGHDVSRFLGWGETGSRAAAPIWVDYMRAALAKRPVRDFPVPDPIVFARIDRKTGLLADATSTETVFQAFLADTEPTEAATKAQSSSQARRLLRSDAF